MKCSVKVRPSKELYDELKEISPNPIALLSMEREFELEEIPGEDYSKRENHLDHVDLESALADEVLSAPLN